MLETKFKVVFLLGVLAWGANYYPGRGQEGAVEFTSLINIRPAQGNRSMELQDPALRERVLELTHALLGEGEPLA